MQETYTTLVTVGEHKITLSVNERTGSVNSVGNEGIHGRVIYDEDKDTFTASTLSGYTSEPFPRSEYRALQWLTTQCLTEMYQKGLDR